MSKPDVMQEYIENYDSIIHIGDHVEIKIKEYVWWRSSVGHPVSDEGWLQGPMKIIDIKHGHHIDWSLKDYTVCYILKSRWFGDTYVVPSRFIGEKVSV